MNVVAAQGNFTVGERLSFALATSQNNPWRVRVSPPGENQPCGPILTVIRTASTEVFGRQQAYEYELFGNASELGTVGSATIDRTINGRRIRLNATATVRPAAEWERANFPDRQYMWDNTTFVVAEEGTEGPDTGETAWQVGETFDVTTTVSSGNPFRTAGTATGVRFRVNGLESRPPLTGVIAERQFEEASRIADLSHYPNLFQRSNDSSPEHQVVYVNEMRANPTAPQYEGLTLAGLALKASRSFASLDQIRFWLPDGMPVRKFQSNAGSTPEASNMFCDLVYHLLTDRTAGAGATISPDLIDTSNFPQLARFHDANRMFFDGVISDPTNIRQFISDTAPFFLCNFVISEGRFGLKPALPVGGSGQISNEPVIQQLFTSGNILEDSFSIEFYPAEDRKDFQAVMRYRQGRPNQLPEERTVTIRWNTEDSLTHSVESFDMTRFCTTREHAELAGKYLLSVRKRVTHSVRFKTTPYGLQLAPGDYIRVSTTSNPYSPANNGVIDANGVITSATPLSDGSYPIIYYISPNDTTAEGTLTVANGVAVEPALRGAIFTVVSAATGSNVYVVDQLSLDEDGVVEISATEFPTRPNTTLSLIADDLQSSGQFIVED